MRVFIMVFAAAIMLGVVPAYAKKSDKPEKTCEDTLLDRHYHSISIIKAMADYKAAMEAGYKGCAAVHKDVFKGTDDLRKFWQKNTDAEMTLAVDIFSYIAATQKLSDDVTAECVEKVSDDVLKIAQSQYKKSYDRRYKVLREGSANLDYDTNDSCRWVIDSLEKYQDMYEKQPAMRNILFRIATGYSWLSKGANREQRAAFRQFDNTRKALIKQQVAQEKAQAKEKAKEEKEAAKNSKK